MKITIKSMLVGILMIPVLALGLNMSNLAVQPTTVAAAQDSIVQGANDAKGKDQSTNLFGTGGIFTTITNLALYLIGAVSVLMLIYGGIRYTISGGDSNAVTGAKNTILYAIVGIVIALLAYAIVNFVLTNLITT